ncbi:DEAD/DEAH box helicase family protein [Rufibacter roseus]|uniref:DEAD/DEAH box helicase family protein n=1 Tax=Rufibacter roseus TaxID=1567108 RepID=A0ABW2DGR1_9BACT|nr:DEAD/DEAH box helicase family protein [Rufibacter roseus]
MLGLEETEKIKLVEFPAGIKFKYPWRKYQARVLHELDQHLENGHLHVIAPPGSGKTILGLEVMLRLNKPTLILAPTLAIRNQWVQRFCDLFLQAGQAPDWISRDIRQPLFLTVTTYQSLHAVCQISKSEAEFNLSAEEQDEEEKLTEVSVNTNANLQEIVRLLQAQGVNTIVVDEAHHLKNEWWKTLTQVKKQLNPTIVGLTATPPYDVTPLEWARYSELSGPVDAEIFVPELVAEGDLCPHQDFVFFSAPTIEEKKKILDFRSKVQKLFEELQQDETLIEALTQHPIMQQPLEQLEWIYTNLKTYSATLIFLHAVGREISPTHLEVIGDAEYAVPGLNYEWMEEVLCFYLFKDPAAFLQYEEHQEHLQNKLKRYSALENRQLSLRHSRKVHTSLGSSLSKLQSIEKIVAHEHALLQENLRLVILTDYIRKELLHPQGHVQPLNKMGAMPVFEQLRRHSPSPYKMGVLTGSVVILPTAALPQLQKLSLAEGVETLTSSPLLYDPSFTVIQQTAQVKHVLVHLITQLFQAGEIEILIGTKSLLGEGWDAPCINSLILASFVGSFVSSNQMRGRAIRAQAGNAAKTGNIWHLVCLDPTDTRGGGDIDLLKRRFKGFVGISFHEEITLENGTARLNLPDQFTGPDHLKAINAHMLSCAQQRHTLLERWNQALEKGATLVEEIKIPFQKERNYKADKRLYFDKTIKYAVGELFFGLVMLSEWLLGYFARAVRSIRSLQDLYYLFFAFLGLGMVFCGRQIYLTLRVYLKYRDIAKDFQPIGEALLVSLSKAGLLQTPLSQLQVLSYVDEYGAVYCHLQGGTTFERSYFIKALSEMVGPIDNPRYVMLRQNKFLKILLQKDYHSVPEAIGRNKALAEFLAQEWRQKVGDCELIFTRNLEGRKLLLKARMHSLASEFEDKTEQLNQWR